MTGDRGKGRPPSVFTIEVRKHSGRTKRIDVNTELFRSIEAANQERRRNEGRQGAAAAERARRQCAVVMRRQALWDAVVRRPGMTGPAIARALRTHPSARGLSPFTICRDVYAIRKAERAGTKEK